MALTTRCPHCGTAFKVVPDQLRVRNGLVRCGACNTVFDGRACLVAHIPQPLSAAAAAAPSAVPRTPAPPPVPEPSLPERPIPEPSIPERSLPEPAASRAEPQLRAAPAAPPAVLRGRTDIRRHDPYLGRHSMDDEAPGFEEQPEDYGSEPDDARAHIAPPAPSAVASAAPHVPAYARQPVDTRERATHVLSDGGAPFGGAPSGGASYGRAPTGAAPGGPAPEADGDYPDPDVVPAVRGEARTRYYGVTDVGRSPPEFLDPERQARRSMVRSLWGYGCVLGLLLLALQMVYVYRTAIAVAMPQLRPLLTSVCEPLGCEIGYARRIERIFITGSSLQPPRGQAAAQGQDDGSRLVLRVSLRNRYDRPQHWPALRLDLTDLSDTVVVRKVLLPDDYLPPGQSAAPFEPGAERTIEVPIEVKGAQVNGYQLDKFFP